MTAVEARRWLAECLIKSGLASNETDVFDSRGQAVYQSPEGVSCLFWIPEEDARWHLYTSLWEVDPKLDANVLALALALNLQPREMQGCSLGLNPESRQLLLFRSLDPEANDLDVQHTLTLFIDQALSLKEQLRSHAFGSSGRDGTSNEFGKKPVFFALA